VSDRIARTAVFSSILLLAGLLRFTNLVNNPGWYTDEGTLLIAAQAFNRGGWNYLGLSDSILLVGRPPFFVWFLALALRLSTDGIATLRTISATLGVLTAASLVWLPGRALGAKARPLGYLAGTAYAVLPFTVLYNRLGFSYNLPALLIPWILFVLYRYWITGDRRWLALGCGLTGLGFLGELWMVAAMPFCIAAAFFKHRRDTPLALAAVLLPGIVYALVMGARYPESFWFDLRYTIGRASFSLLDQIGLVTMNYGLILSNQAWVLLGLVGLVVLRDSRFRNFAVAFLGITFAFAARSLALVGLGAYQFLPLAPVICLGIGSFLLAAHWYLDGWVSAGLEQIDPERHLRPLSRKALTIGVSILVLGTPWLVIALNQVQAVTGNLPSEISYALIDPEDARLAAAYINARTASEDLVIASPALAWLIDARVTDFQVSLAYDGHLTRHFPTDIPRSRFTFDPRADQARFVVVDRIWDNWAASQVPDLGEILDEIATWPLAAEFGEFRIYQNEN